MNGPRQPRVALVWAQFAAYHTDRCEAVGRRLGGKAQVLAVEVATTSATYAWEASAQLGHATKRTLFPGASYEQVPWWRRALAMWRAVRGCQLVCLGISYADPAAVALAWALRLTGWPKGRRVIALCDSKFDDKPRRLPAEWLKAMNLLAYDGAILAGRRQYDYFRFLGFGRRPLWLGYDTIASARVAALAAGAQPLPFDARPFVYIGRFVAKKNLFFLLEGYARYVALAGAQARRLMLIGEGELAQALRARIAELGLEAHVDLPGFLTAEAVGHALGRAHALLLLSTEEQWGLVVNEAVAAGRPVIVTDQIGARDALVRNLVSGHVVEDGNVAGLAAAMLQLAQDEAHWHAMAQGAQSRAWAGDAERLADAVELCLNPQAEPAATAMRRLFAENGFSTPPGPLA